MFQWKTIFKGNKKCRLCRQVVTKTSLISHAWSLSSFLCMADRQLNGFKSVFNSGCCYGRQPVKTNSFNQIVEMQTLLETNRTLLFLAHFSWLRCNMKGQKITVLEMWFSLWNSDTVRQMTFWYPLFKLFWITHAWTMHQMKEEELSFTNMCYLLIKNCD